MVETVTVCVCKQRRGRLEQYKGGSIVQQDYLSYSSNSERVHNISVGFLHLAPDQAENSYSFANITIEFSHDHHHLPTILTQYRKHYPFLTKTCLKSFKFWKKHQKKPCKSRIRLRPSAATAVSDRLIPASDNPSPLRAVEAPSNVRITPNVTAGHPTPESTVQLLTPSARSGTPTAELDCAQISRRAISSSQFLEDLPQASAASRQAEFWNRAYNQLKSEEPDIVEAYENLLSVKIVDIDGLPNNKTQNLISTSTQERWVQMRKVAEDGLKKTQRSTAVQERVSNVIQTVSPFKKVIDQIVQFVPQAAVPWAGVSLAFEILSNPFTEPGINRDGVNYVISRMEWYMNLTEPLLDGSAKLQVIRHRQFEDHTVELYQKILLYQMKSICCFYKNSLNKFLRNIVKVDDWSGQLEKIKAAEKVVSIDLQACQNQAILDHFRKQSQGAEHQFEMLQKVAAQIKFDKENEIKDKECLIYLCHTDPSLDKDRILETKGELLKTSYYWIIDNPEFQQWRMDKRGAVDYGSRETQAEARQCFCAVLSKSLKKKTACAISSVKPPRKKYHRLISHVRKEYDQNQRLFEDHNAWQALCRVLESILEDDDLGEVWIIVDALDECKDMDDREKLLKFICKVSAGSRAKLIVSSRNWPDIRKQLGKEEEHAMTLSLELNENSISHAVNSYIEQKVKDLHQAEPYKSNPDLCRLVRDHLIENSSNTFLWVALVCQELSSSKTTTRRDVKKILSRSPPGLQGLYSRMIENISNSNDPDDLMLCMEILAVVSVVNRPVTIPELFHIISSSLYPFLEPEDLEGIIGSCGSFLNIQKGTIYLVHQSAVEFLHSNASKLPSIAMRHRSIFWNSLDALLMSEHMKRDIYGLEAPATPYEAIELPEPDPLSALHYCCTYWVDHLAKWIRGGNTISTTTPPTESEAICKVQNFLDTKFLYWIESLALHGQMQQAVRAIQKLQTLFKGMSGAAGQRLAMLVNDATRFLLYHRLMIETTPFQLYASAIVFSPEESVVKRTLWHVAPKWVTIGLGLDANWSACLQTLVGHTNDVRTVEYSSDGQWVISGSDDGTAKLWDTETYTCINTLGGHGVDLDLPYEYPEQAAVEIAAFSNDSQKIVTGSRNGIKLWNRANGICIHETQHNLREVRCMAVSSDHRRIAFALSKPNSTVSIYNVEENNPVLSLDGDADVESMSLSPNGKRLATASKDRTVKIWDLTTGDCERTLDEQGNILEPVHIAFSNNGQQLASSDTAVRVWEAETGKLVSKFPCKSGRLARAVDSMVFSRDDRLLVAASDFHIYVWDIAKEALIWRVGTARVFFIRSLAISHDASRLLSAASDDTIKVWDLSTTRSANTSEDGDAPPWLTCFSTDGNHVAAYYGKSQTIKDWNMTLAGHRTDLHCDDKRLTAIALSPDNKRVASASYTRTITVWDLESGACMGSFGMGKAPEDADIVQVTLAFRDDRQLASSASGIVKIWKIPDGICADTFDHPSHRNERITFSGDGRWLAYGSFAVQDGYRCIPGEPEKCRIMIRNMESKVGCWTRFTVFGLRSLSFSPVEGLLASASRGEINLWDVETASRVWRFKDDGFRIFRVSFDSQFHRRLRTELGYTDLEDVEPSDLTRSPTKLDIMGANSTGQDCSSSDESDSQYSNLGSNCSLDSEYLEGTFPFSGYGFSRNRDWIARNGEKLLWIPSDYRLARMATSDKMTPVMDGSVLTWENRTGKVVRVHFAEA